MATDFPVFTVGHSNRSWPEFLHVLQAVPVSMIYDVRRFPVSRRHPHFCKDTMSPALHAAGIGYRHFPDLGGYREDTADGQASIHDGWPPGFLRQYAGHALGDSFRAALADLRRALVPGSAIMCAEKDWRACHRQIIADYLLVAGHSLIHVVDADTHEPAELTRFARVNNDGGIVYAADRPQLELVFHREPKQ